jgi:hypothetical protein
MGIRRVANGRNPAVKHVATESIIRQANVAMHNAPSYFANKASSSCPAKVARNMRMYIRASQSLVLLIWI